MVTPPSDGLGLQPDEQQQLVDHLGDLMDKVFGGRSQEKRAAEVLSACAMLGIQVDALTANARTLQLQMEIVKRELQLAFPEVFAKMRATETIDNLKRAGAHVVSVPDGLSPEEAAHRARVAMQSEAEIKGGEL